MTKKSECKRAAPGQCLTTEDLYLYIVQAPGNRTADTASHLAACESCRGELAGVLKLLHPEAIDDAEFLPEPSAVEIDQTVRLIQNTAKGNQGPDSRWIPRAAAAAAALILIGSGFWGFVQLRDNARSTGFLLQAKAELETVYEGQSPSELRLDLPFHSTASTRGGSDSEALHQAEALFHQALALKTGMAEAHLGLASIYLSQSQFGRAQSEFQTVLESDSGNRQALIGRGVTRFEQAEQTSDVLQRNALLSGALEDFDTVLNKEPSCAAAMYNKVWVLYETGRHREALKEIDSYLGIDSGSIWAEKLKGLKGRIGFTSARNVDDEVERAAAARDSVALTRLAVLAPYQVSGAIRSALKQSLEIEGEQAVSGKPSAGDLDWAAQALESEYRRIAADHSCRKLIDFYHGLSPPQRHAKKSLDGGFQKLVARYEKGDFASVLQDSRFFIRQYTALQDNWQLCNTYHLLGNSCYYGPADFERAITSYRFMLTSAERASSPDLIAKALGALAAACLEHGRLDEAYLYGTRLKETADRYRLASWQSYGTFVLGDFYRRLNRNAESRREYSQALKDAYRLNNELVLLNALEGLGTVSERMGQLREAQLLYAEEIRQQEDAPRNPTKSDRRPISARKLNLLCREGDLFLRLGILDKAETYFRESLRSTGSEMRELEARNRLGLAMIFISQKRLESARNELARVSTIPSLGQYPEAQWQAEYLSGRLLQETRTDSAALARYESAIGIIEGMREEARTSDLRQSFLDYRFDPYKAAVTLLFHSIGDKDKAHQYVERSKSMTLREHLRAFNQKSGHGWPLQTPSPMPAAGLAHAAILDYFVADDEVFIFLDGPRRRDAISVKVGRKDLEKEVSGFLESIRTGDRDSFTFLSRKLHREIIEPLGTELAAQKAELLVILPDGPLHMLPFGALQDSNARFLLEELPIVYAPSRGVYEYSLSLNRRTGSSTQSILLLDGSTNLEHAGSELARLSRLYARGSRILGANDLANFGRVAPQYEIIHFAGHAEDDAGTAGLILKPGSSDFRLDSRTIGTWRLPRACLVNLAGCSTGIGPRSEGEAPWGLVPAFLSAGAPSVLVSLMPVDDGATEKLNSRFYELLLQDSHSKAQALQLAQLALLASARAAGGPSPLSWAPYVLIGDPR